MEEDLTMIQIRRAAEQLPFEVKKDTDGNHPNEADNLFGQLLGQFLVDVHAIARALCQIELNTRPR